MKLLKNLTVTFLPWVLYTALVHYAGMTVDLACLISIATQLCISFHYLKKLFIINWVILQAFLITFFLYKFSYAPQIQNDPWLICSFALAIISWLSLWLRKPMMQQYAKQEVPVEKWQHPLFIKINMVLTIVWATIFTVSFIIHIGIIYSKNWQALVLFGYLLSSLGIIFTLYYPSMARKNNN